MFRDLRVQTRKPLGLEIFLPQFYASCALGLVDELDRELKLLGFDKVSKAAHGVYFETNWEGCYKANLWCRYASRIVKPILDFPAYNSDDLYHNIQKHDFTKYIPATGDLDIVSSVKESMLKDQRFVTMRIKDAIVDQFREKYGERPSISEEHPDLRIIAQAYRNQFSISVDTSGETLHRRGYRDRTGIAPLKENLAAGLLSMARWEPGTPLVDPLCGSGTFLIEAALMAARIAPGLLRKEFGFERLNGFNREAWEALIDEAISQEAEPGEVQIFGSDIDGKVLRTAKENARRAGVDDWIQFKKEEVALSKPPTERSGTVICNPPYGERMGDVDNVKDVYRDLGFALRSHYSGWDAFVLSGHPELTMELKMKADRKFVVMNGPINCRFLHYPIRSGKPSGKSM